MKIFKIAFFSLSILASDINTQCHRYFLRQNGEIIPVRNAIRSPIIPTVILLFTAIICGLANPSVNNYSYYNNTNTNTTTNQNINISVGNDNANIRYGDSNRTVDISTNSFTLERIIAGLCITTMLIVVLANRRANNQRPRVD